MLYGKYEEYKPRTFCNDVRCPVQLKLNMHEKNAAKCNEIKETCRNSCLFPAKFFDTWMTLHGFYSIDDYGKKLKETPEIRAKKNALTTWKFHKWLTDKGFVIVKPRN
jgi:phage antirepressor YoqD-like protein